MRTRETSTLPLAGVRVLDLTRALAGPFCTALLADFGADVIKVEGLPDGDGARGWPPFDGDRSLYFDSINRNKRSVAVDLRSTQGAQVVRRLAQFCDVIVENFRPGVLTAMGLEPAQLRLERPELVITSVSGFGPVGPDRTAAGLDQIAQGMCGLMSVTGTGADTPLRVGVPIIDITTGMLAAFATAAALTSREHTGIGAWVQGSLLETGISLMTFQAQDFLATGRVAFGHGNDHPAIPAYGLFRTADDPINIAVGSPAHFAVLCHAVGGDHLLRQPEFADIRQLVNNRERFKDAVQQLLAAHGAEYWVTRLRAAGLPCGPVHRLDQVFDDPQVRALGMVQQVTLPTGQTQLMLRGPLWIDGAPSAIHSPPPALGHDTLAVLTEAGFGAAEIRDALARGAVHASAPPVDQ